MERTKSAENHSNLDFDCGYHVYDHDNGSRSVHWDITIYADGAGGESEWKPLCNLPSAKSRTGAKAARR